MSALSPILATAIPTTNTFGEPAFTFATWSGQGGAGGLGWGTVGSPNVFVEGLEVARKGDSADAGNMTQGSGNVFANG